MPDAKKSPFSEAEKRRNWRFRCYRYATKTLKAVFHAKRTTRIA